MIKVGDKVVISEIPDNCKTIRYDDTVKIRCNSCRVGDEGIYVNGNPPKFIFGKGHRDYAGSSCDKLKPEHLKYKSNCKLQRDLSDLAE